MWEHSKPDEKGCINFHVSTDLQWCILPLSTIVVQFSHYAWLPLLPLWREDSEVGGHLNQDVHWRLWGTGDFTESSVGNCSPRGESRRTQAREVTSPHSFRTGLEVAVWALMRTVVLGQLVFKTRFFMLLWEEANEEESPSVGFLFSDFRL